MALAHPPSCGGGQGWGVARTEEIIECAIAGSSRRTARPPSSILPHKGGATVFAVKLGAMAFARG
jgi:hypothetical protein